MIGPVKLVLAVYSCCMVGALLAQNVTEQHVATGDEDAKADENSWDPSPCKFYLTPSNKNALHCHKITSQSALEAIFATLPYPLVIDVFQLTKSQVKVISAGIFGKAKFRDAKFMVNDIEAIQPDAFQGMEDTLLDLFIGFNKIKTMDFISQMKVLGSFIVRAEEIEEIPDYAFANLKELRKIDFMDCPLKSIGSYAFVNTSKLSLFSISTNYAALTKIGDFAFSRPDCSAVKVDLRETQLTDNVFSNTSFMNANIESLRLDINQLTTFQEEVFSPLVQNNTRITADRNPLKCDSSLKWIATNQAAKDLFNGNTCYKDGQPISLSELKESDL